MTDKSTHVKDRPAEPDEHTATDEHDGKPMRGHPKANKVPIQGLFVEDDGKRGAEEPEK
ncbi:MAG: hypothetical protein ACU0CI_10380 [Shimia sp.]